MGPFDARVTGTCEPSGLGARTILWKYECLTGLSSASIPATPVRIFNTQTLTPKTLSLVVKTTQKKLVVLFQKVHRKLQGHLPRGTQKAVPLSYARVWDPLSMCIAPFTHGKCISPLLKAKRALLN